MRMLALLLVVGMLGVGRAQEPVAPKPEIPAEQEVPKKADAKPLPIKHPSVIKSFEPEYTKEALKARITGDVLLIMHIGIDGKAKDIHVLRGLGYGLDEKAVESIQRYQFKPATQDGKPVEVELKIAVNFNPDYAH